MRREEAVEIFGTHWTVDIVRRRAEPPRDLAAKLMAGFRLEEYRGIIRQNLGPNLDPVRPAAATLEDAGILLAEELSQKVWSILESIKGVERRFKRGRFESLLESIVNSVEGRRSGLRKDILRECRDIREDLEKVIGIVDVTKLSAELGDFLVIETHRLADELTIPEAIYGTNGIDAIIYRVMVPTYLEEAHCFSIVAYKVAHAEVTAGQQRSGEEVRNFTVSYKLDPLDSNAQIPRLGIGHDELDALITFQVKKHQLPEPGHCLCATVEDAQEHIREIKEKVVCALLRQPDVRLAS